MTINLTYLVATKNKLPFSKKTLAKAISNKQPNEEIIVIDGNSTDETKEYLSELANDHRIDSFVSAIDYGTLGAELCKLLIVRSIPTVCCFSE